QVIVAMSGLPQLVVKLLYGSGLRLLEALRLRVQDLDFEMKQLPVRDGKGAKDRFTVRSESLISPLREHMERVRLTHHEDLRQGGGSVYLRGLWIESFPRRRGNGAGSMYFPRGIFQPIRVLASGAVTTLMRGPLIKQSVVTVYPRHLKVLQFLLPQI